MVLHDYHLENYLPFKVMIGKNHEKRNQLRISANKQGKDSTFLSVNKKWNHSLFSNFLCFLADFSLNIIDVIIAKYSTVYEFLF